MEAHKCVERKKRRSRGLNATFPKLWDEEQEHTIRYVKVQCARRMCSQGALDEALVAQGTEANDRTRLKRCVQETCNQKSPTSWMSLAEVGSTKVTKRTQCGQITVVKKWCFRRYHWRGAGRLQISKKVSFEEMNWLKQKDRQVYKKVPRSEAQWLNFVPRTVRLMSTVETKSRRRTDHAWWRRSFVQEGCVRRDTASGSIASVGEYTRDLWL